ncbi:MAG: hypothetical protein EA356_12490, partial [Geminicoccaceae bacterium]
MVAVFDSLKATKELRAAGMPEGQAEALVGVLATMIVGNLASKEDIARSEAAVRADIDRLETSLRADIDRL